MLRIENGPAQKKINRTLRGTADSEFNLTGLKFNPVVFADLRVKSLIAMQ